MGRCQNTSARFENSRPNGRQLSDLSNCRLRQKSAISGSRSLRSLQYAISILRLYQYCCMLCYHIDVNSSLPDDRMPRTARALGYLYYWPPRGGGGLVSSTPPGGSTIKAREPSSRFHSYVRESYWQHPMGFSLRKLQTSISPEPLIAQRADFAWKLIWARGIG